MSGAWITSLMNILKELTIIPDYLHCMVLELVLAGGVGLVLQFRAL